MRLERVRHWQWMLISVVVGLALAYARRLDQDALPSRLGEGVADRQWFEREVQRRVKLADGSTIPAFSRLKVYPLTVEERGGRRRVHVVGGMYLAKAEPGAGKGAGNGAGRAGKLRPYFFIAPVPFQSLADERARKPVHPSATVRTYLDTLAGKGVTYSYAWWADVRYATAAWVGGSFVLIGLLWPTAVNLLAYGTFRAPVEEKGVSLWRVKSSTPVPAPTAAAGAASTSRREQPKPAARPASVDVLTGAPRPSDPAPLPEPPVLATAPVEAAGPVERAHKQFGAGRDDFYPTELKAGTSSAA